jgi:hypothetical protein
MNPGGKNRSSVQSTNRVGTDGQASSGHGARPGAGLIARLAASLFGQGRGDILVDQVLSGVPLRLPAHDLIEAGVGGPVVRSLSRGRHHPGHQDQHVDGNPGGYQRRGDPPKDCATTIRPRRPPIALTTVSACAASPAESSSQGKSGAKVSVSG